MVDVRLLSSCWAWAYQILEMQTYKQWIQKYKKSKYSRSKVLKFTSMNPPSFQFEVGFSPPKYTLQRSLLGQETSNKNTQFRKSSWWSSPFLSIIYGQPIKYILCALWRTRDRSRQKAALYVDVPLGGSFHSEWTSMQGPKAQTKKNDLEFLKEKKVILCTVMKASIKTRCSIQISLFRRVYKDSRNNRQRFTGEKTWMRLGAPIILGLYNSFSLRSAFT